MPCRTDPWRPWRWPAALLAGALLAAGCGTAPPVADPPAPPPMDPPVAAQAPAASAPTVAAAPAAAPSTPSHAPAADALLGRLLAFHERFRTLPAADAAREQARLAADGSAEATLQLAWALGLPQAPGRAPGDLTRALALLDPLARGDSPEAPLARLLLARLTEQRRLEEQLDRQAQQQRDLQRRNDQLREQLDALRAIERSLGPRQSAPASAPRTP
ncbi:hypothetical protein [Rubrivivax albus]|uniref:hypothetical protein n=1 Tax=Rubrivivax albus TaxID=2499835 RepID=UPI001E4ED0D9|nr:hypothetical protein [Rubrivivax albus]